RMTPKTSAHSATDLAIGPTQSCSAEIGMTPVDDTACNDGLNPTTPQAAAGDVIEPSVSDPSATGTMPAATAAALPDDEPDGLRSSTCGLRVCPPRPLQPEIDRVERKFAHSEQ